MDLKEALRHARARNRLTIVNHAGERYILCTDGFKFRGDSLRTHFYAHCHEMDIIEREVAQHGKTAEK